MKIVGLATNPGQEALELWIGLEPVHVGEAAGQFSFGKTRVNGRMADLVKVYRAQLGASLQLGRQVVPAEFGVFRYRALAQRAKAGLG